MVRGSSTDHTKKLRHLSVPQFLTQVICRVVLSPDRFCKPTRQAFHQNTFESLMVFQFRTWKNEFNRVDEDDRHRSVVRRLVALRLPHVGHVLQDHRRPDRPDHLDPAHRRPDHPGRHDLVPDDD